MQWWRWRQVDFQRISRSLLKSMSCFILAMTLPKVSMLLLLFLLLCVHVSDCLCVHLARPSPTVNNDYTGRMLILNFTQDEVQSIHIPILDDNLVEDTEFFFVNLTTTQDDLIHLGNTTASVSILDNDSKSCSIY